MSLINTHVLVYQNASIHDKSAVSSPNFIHCVSKMVFFQNIDFETINVKIWGYHGT